MPRGVYTRKKAPAKRAAKKATPTARRPRRRVAEIPSISLSTLRSFVSGPAEQKGAVVSVGWYDLLDCIRARYPHAKSIQFDLS